MFKWSIELTGPKDSVYAVCTSPPPATALPAGDCALTGVCVCDGTGRDLQAIAHSPHQLPLQAARAGLPDENIPSKCQQRRQGQHVPGDSEIGSVEAELQDHVGVGDGKGPAGGAESVRRSSTAPISFYDIYRVLMRL